jgi:ABC-type iron transport system FetAB ATPase subunit
MTTQHTHSERANDLQLSYFASEYAAVSHILSAPLLARRTAAYILDDDFDWEGLGREAETMSGGERLLVRIAYELWNAEKSAGLWEISNRLDSANFRRVIEALLIYRGYSNVALLEAAVRDRRDETLAA